MTQTKTRRPRRTYTDEFKNQLVQLYLNGKRKCDIVREYDISSSLLDKWIKQSTSTGSFKEKDNRSEDVYGNLIIDSRCILKFYTNSIKLPHHHDVEG